MTSIAMRTFAHVLHQAYLDCPDRVAAYLMLPKQADVPIPYRDLLRGSAGYAGGLAQAGIGPGEVVVTILQHGPALMYAFWGAVLRGAIPSILPFLTEKLAPEKYRQDLAALIEVTRPAAIITYREFAPEVEAAVAVARAGGHNTVRAVLVGKDVTPGEPDFAALGGLNRLPNDIALLQHSSGTTGLQKGVALSHQAVFNQLDAYSRAIRLTQDDVIVSWLPLYHDMGLIASFILPILSRAPVVMMSPFDWVRAPAKLMQAITRYRGTLCWLPNFAYNFCAQKIRARDLEGVDLSSLRAVTNCSEPIHWASHQAFLDKFAPYGLRAGALAVSYAMAENVFGVTQGGIDAPLVIDEVDARAFLTEGFALPSPSGREVGGEGMRLVSSGRPIDNTQVRVLDEQRRELPERRVGELAIRSDCMLTGYYHRDDLTQQAFHDGWFLTGDLGYVAGGEVFVTGRKKDLIIVGGKNVAPQDLERVAGDVPGVHPGRVVAFGVYSDSAGTEDVVIVAEADAAAGAEGEEERLRISDAIRAAISRGSDVTLRDAYVVGAKWLLKTSSGKIARSANRDKYLAEI